MNHDALMLVVSTSVLTLERLGKEQRVNMKLHFMLLLHEIAFHEEAMFIKDY